MRFWRGWAGLAGVSVGYLALRFLLSPLQIRILTGCLDKADYGVISVLTGTVTLLAVLMSLGHFEFMIRRLPGLPDALQWAVLRRLRAWYLPLAALAALGVGVALQAVPGLCLDGRGLGLAPRALVALALVLVAALLQRIFFLVARADWVRVRSLQLLQGDTWFVPFVIAYALGARGLTAALGVWVFWLGCTVLLAHVWSRRRGMTTALPVLPPTLGGRAALAFGLPLLPWLVGELLLRLTDRYVILAFHGPEAVARYTLCANIAMIVYVFGASIMDPFIPELSRLRNHADAAAGRADAAAAAGLFSTMLRLALAVGLAGGAFLGCAGRPLLALLSGARYPEAAALLPWLAPVPALFLLWACCARLLLLDARTRRLGALTLGGVVFSLGLNLALVRLWGARGAAITLTVTLAGLSLATALAARAWRALDWHALRPLRLVVWPVLCAALLWGLRQAWPAAPVLPWLLAAAGLCALAGLALGLVRHADLAVWQAAHAGRKED